MRQLRIRLTEMVKGVGSIAFLVGIRDELQIVLADPLDLDTLKMPQSETYSKEEFACGWSDALTNV